MNDRHVLLLHARLDFTGGTERLLAVAKRLLEEGARVSVAAQDGSRRRAFEELGLPVHVIDLPHDPRRAPFAAWRVRRLVRSLHPDLVHVATEEIAALAAWIAPTLSMPYVLEVHRKCTRRIPRYGPRLAAVGLSAPTLAASAVNVGRIPRELLCEVKHAPRPPAHLDPAPFAHEGTLRIGCAGRIDRAGGCETFVRAVERLRDLPRPCHFAVLGEGPGELALRRLARELGLGTRLSIGVPPTADAARTLAGLDLHVSCRLEAGPDWLAHLALSMGTPSILSAVGESFHLVEDGVSGLLVERGDPDLLAQRIAQLIETPLMARTMGQKGRERWLANHPPEELTQSLAALHARALEPANT